jgi:hypothetical protein
MDSDQMLNLNIAEQIKRKSYNKDQHQAHIILSFNGREKICK